MGIRKRPFEWLFLIRKFLTLRSLPTESVGIFVAFYYCSL
nr:MAG TPA: hypothetical protein [Caudoviricetes sp.]